jgi:phenylacetate-CoA ligase
VSNSSAQGWPPLRLGLAAEIAAIHAEFEESQWLVGEALEIRQMAQFRQMLAFASTHSPVCARQLELSGLGVEAFTSLEALHRLPVLTRQDLQRSGSGFFCKGVPADQGKVFETQSSGSTGEPVRVKKTGINQLFWYGYLLRNHSWHRLPFAARYSVIRQSAERYQENLNWGAPYELLFRTGPIQAIPISTPLTEQIGLLRKFQPEMLLIYPTNLRAMLEIWRRDGSGLTNLQFIRCIGETLPDDLRRAVAEFDRGIYMVDTYSSEECGTITLQCPDAGGHHVMSESLIVEILDESGNACEPGQTGRIVITDLQNLASPIVRYDTGDYAQLGGQCACGRGLRRLEKVLGRRRNLVVRPNGDRHYPLVGFQQFDAIAPIRQFQMVQETLQRVTVRFVTEQPLTPEQKSALADVVQDALAYPFELEIIDQREYFPRQAGGKFEEFISRVA